MREKAKEGKAQLKGVQPSRLSASSYNYVISCYFATEPVLSTQEGSAVMVVDPEGSISGDNASEHADLLIRNAYAKVCRYAQMDLLADQLLDSKDWELNAAIPEHRGLVPIGFDPFGNVLALTGDVFRVLATNSSPNLHERIL